MNHIRRSGGLFGVLAVFSVALALLTSASASAWSDANANTIASMMTDGGACSGVITDKNKVIVALKAIPDSTTAANVGGLKGDWPSGPMVTAIMQDGYHNLIMGNNGSNCFDIDKIVVYGINKANNNTTPAPTQNTIQKAIMDQVNAKLGTWVNEICKTSTDPQCQTATETQIKKLAISCYTSTTTTVNTKLNTYQDLEKCAGANIVNVATAQQDCENSGKVWNTTTKVCEEKKAGTTNCVIDGVGWIVCPVANAMATMTDRVFELLKMMLQTPPLSVVPNASTNPLYGAWSSMRNIANIVFVIAFMIIIYSQITSAGISNYGIKKMLPKLLVSAILINVSFWICVLAVDLSNVLGSSLYNVLSGFTTSSGGGSGSVSWESVITVLLGGAAAGALTYGGVTIAATALGGGGALSVALLWLALPMLLAVAIAIIIGATVLALRQALIIMLVFVSPLAFAAYLLPNTQTWFDKWRKLFTTMLVFYPLFALLFGGANIASWVLLSSAGSATTSLKGVLILTGMLVLFLPLFLVPMLIKTSSGLLGRFATRMQGGMQRAANPLNKMARGRTAMSMGLAKGRLLTGSTTATNRFGRRTLASRVNGLAQSIDSSGRTRKMIQEDLDATRNANWQEQVAQDSDLSNIDINSRVQKQRQGSAQRVQDEQYYKAMDASANLRNVAAGIDPNGQERVLASVVAGQQKANKEAVENSKALLYDDDPGLTIDRAVAQLKTANASGDVVAARAAAQVLRESGTPGKQSLHDTIVHIEDNGGFNTNVSQGIKADGLSSGAKGYDSSIDRWYAETDKPDASGTIVPGARLKDLDNDSASVVRLNEQELAGQTGKLLQIWESNGVISKKQAQSVLEAHEKRTIHLDPKKLELFERIYTAP